MVEVIASTDIAEDACALLVAPVCELRLDDNVPAEDFAEHICSASLSSAF